jgi:aspartate kinase
MQIYKFGGASVRNTKTISSLKNIISQNNGELIVVVSAMGKTTQQLEILLNKYLKAWFNIQENFTSVPKVQRDKLNASIENWNHNNKEALDEYTNIKNYHYQIVNEIIKENISLNKIGELFNELEKCLEQEPSYNYDYEYDRIVSYGELVSTRIINAFLIEQGFNSKWIDIRKGIKTGNFYRDAQVNWELTEQFCQRLFTFEKEKLYITQGFIGSTVNNHTTTLGREGSDFSAAILAYTLKAENVTIWKDVDGVYNGDPKIFKEVELLEKISYQEAIEQTYYGAKVIHPKTIKPLQNKKIPLYVKSFETPESPGTLIHSYEKWNRGSITKDVIPVFISKNNQVLIRVIPFDYSFIAEENLSKIFSLFAKYRIRVNLMQNTAISFSASFDHDVVKIPPFLEELKAEFECEFNFGYELLTVRHFDDIVISEIIGNREIVIEEKNSTTARFLLK